MYTIGQVSELFALPISTLRYYEKEGLLLDVPRISGRRLYGEKELEALRVIACLKESGLEIKDIKLFMQWCAAGPATYGKRKALFENRKAAVEAEISTLQKTLNMLNFKCWYYEKAMADGNEDAIQAMLPDRLPPEIQTLYDNRN